MAWSVSARSKKARVFALVPAAAAALLVAAGCSNSQVASDTPGTTPPMFTSSPAPAPEHHGPEVLSTGHRDEPAAVIDMKESNGTDIGKVIFRQEKDDVIVVAKLSGLTPGKHGFHVHQNGVCEGDFTSAGAHFNKGNQTPEAGDLGTLNVGQDGTVEETIKTDDFTLQDITGKTVIVHDSVDVNKRIACGKIGG